MHGVFDCIRGLLQVDAINVDSNVFKLHYKVTVFMLLAASLLLTQRQYFGDPIDCLVHDVDPAAMDTYCWIHATYTIPALTGGKVGEDVAHPGVAPDTHIGGEKHEIKHHKYYQWATLMLALQALLFYFPKYLWDVWEGGKIQTLVTHLNEPIVDDDVKRERKDMLVSYLKLNFNGHDLYYMKYMFCEMWNFVNVLGQIFLTDWFLGNTFTSYGSDVLAFGKQEIGTRHDPMDEVFPKVAKCTFYRHGAGGSKEVHDGLCVLPLNVINEKVYVFLWFWFIVLAVVTALGLVYRGLLFMPGLRTTMLQLKSRLAPNHVVDCVARKCTIGDWFLLTQIAKNMDPLIYKEFMEEFAEKMQA